MQNIEDEEMMGLRASNFALLNLFMEQNVHETMLRLRMPPEFFLFRINIAAERTFTEFKDCFLDSAIAKQFNKPQVRKREEQKSTGYKKSVHKRIMEKIKGVYKGLDSYENKPIDLSKDPLELARTKGKQGWLLTCLLLLLILGITIVLLVVRGSVTKDMMVQSGINSEIVSNETYSFFDIESLSDIQDYIQYTLGPAMFSENSSSTAPLARYYRASDLRIRQVRTNTAPCKHSGSYAIPLTCYEYTYSDSTRNTSNLTASSNSTASFQVYHGTSTSYTFVGQIESYDGSGYYVDFDRNLDYQSFQEQVQNVYSTNWLDNSTRAVFISMNLYLSNTQQFVNIMLMVEINVMGQAFPSSAQSNVLIANFYTGSHLDNGMLALEIIRMLTSFYFIYLFIEKGMSPNIEGEKKISNWFTVKGISNLVLVGIILTAFGFSMQVNTSFDTILSANGYYDLNLVGYYYRRFMILNAWVFVLVFYRLIEVFRFSNGMVLYLTTFDLAARNFVYYLLLILPLLIGMSIFTMQMLGSFDFNYRSLKYVAISNMLFYAGVRNVNDFYYITEAWTIGFLFVYMFIMMLFMFGGFLGILLDAYRMAEQRHIMLMKAVDATPDYKPWKIWLQTLFEKCKRKKAEKVVEDDDD
jgi:hypothetical protein